MIFIFFLAQDGYRTSTIVCSPTRMRIHLPGNYGLFDFSNDPKQFLLRHVRSKRNAVSKYLKIKIFEKLGAYLIRISQKP